MMAAEKNNLSRKETHPASDARILSSSFAVGGK